MLPTAPLYEEKQFLLQCMICITIHWCVAGKSAPLNVTLTLQINLHKADKELSEVAARWEEIKKGTSQVQHGTIYCFHKIVSSAIAQHNACLVQWAAASPSRTARLQVSCHLCNAVSLGSVQLLMSHLCMTPCQPSIY